MPRIPQSEFDTNPSTRVAAPNFQLAADPMDNMIKSVSNLVGAAAQLRDQTERTEAYDYANKAKETYLQKKIQYAAALETVDGTGTANYFDPTDTNPDITKRRRVTRPISELQAEMIDSYEEQKRGLSKITRGDIAGDLMRTYVGDDLVQLQMRTDKHINQVREKETRKRLNDNMELNVIEFGEVALDETASGEDIELGLAQLDRRIKSELIHAGPVVGDQGVKEYNTIKDKTYGQVAMRLISHRVDNNTVKAAEGIMNRISDPMERDLARMRIEKQKKTTATVTAMSVFSEAENFKATLSNKNGITPEDKMKSALIARKVAGLYIDAQYTPGFDPEKQKKLAVEVIGAAYGKDILQKNMTSNLQWLDKLPAEFKFTPGTKFTSGNSAGGVKPSEEFVSKLKSEKMEGFREEAYGDQGKDENGNWLGVPTIGFGRTRHADGTPVKYGDKTTKEEEEKFVQKHMEEASSYLSDKVSRKDLTQSQQDVLVDMYYNLGPNKMQSFLKVVNEGTPAQIEASLKQYTKTQKRDANGDPVLDEQGEPIYLEMRGSVARMKERLAMWRMPAAPQIADADKPDNVEDSIAAAKLKDLENQINKEVATSGIANALGGTELVEDIKKHILDTARSQRTILKDNLVDIVKAEYPNLSPSALMNKVQLIADEQGFGDPKFASDKTSKEFLKNFETTLAKDPDAAFGFFAQHTMHAGEKSRGLVIDLVGKESKYGFLIAAADADQDTQMRMVADAAAYRNLLSTTKITPANLADTLTPIEGQIPALGVLKSSNPSVYHGVRQAIINRAAARLDGRPNVTEKDVPAEIEAAIKETKHLYTSIGHGRSTILGVNSPSKNYGKESRDVIEKGIDASLTLPHLKPEDKQTIFREYFPQHANNNFSEERIDWILQHGLKIVPDGRQPNMHIIQTNNNTPLAINRGTETEPKYEVVKISMDDIHKFGKAKKHTSYERRVELMQMGM